MANRSFSDVVGKMPEYLRTLKSREFVPDIDGNLPLGLPNAPGIYCFYEDGEPQYVGRSRNIRKRVRQHRRRGGRHNAAQFAFNIAKKKFGLDKAGNMERKELENHPEFKTLFADAKKRVRKMSVRFVEIHDPIEQTIFEVCAHMELGTPEEFNNFETH